MRPQKTWHVAKQISRTSSKPRSRRSAADNTVYTEIFQLLGWAYKTLQAGWFLCNPQVQRWKSAGQPQLPRSHESDLWLSLGKCPVQSFFLGSPRQKKTHSSEEFPAQVPHKPETPTDSAPSRAPVWANQDGTRGIWPNCAGNRCKPRSFRQGNLGGFKEATEDVNPKPTLW